MNLDRARAARRDHRRAVEINICKTHDLNVAAGSRDVRHNVQLISGRVSAGEQRHVAGTSVADRLRDVEVAVSRRAFADQDFIARSRNGYSGKAINGRDIKCAVVTD